MTEPDLAAYHYTGCSPPHAQAYLLPPVLEALSDINWVGSPRRVFELGCGNGAMTAELAARGYEVIGVDPSETGILHARHAYPHIQFHLGSAYDDLAGRYGGFPAVISMEVVEHVFFPRRFAACVFKLLEPGGTAIISTPYHGYLKNLLVALTGKMDSHFTVLWDYGHIKFWSIKTLSILLKEAGFSDVRFLRVGRIPPLAKSMIAIARRPAQP